MADNTRNYIGIAMGLDVTDLKAGLQETKKEIQTANKQFAAATSGMDKWSDNAEGLNAKLSQLNTVLTNQKKNVAGIEAELEKAKNQYGENSEQVRILTNKLLDAQAAVGKTERAQRKYTKQLEEVEKGEREAGDAADKLTRELKETDDATEQLQGGFTVLKGALAGLVTQGISAFVGGLKNAVEESREFRQELAYLEQGAEDAGVSFEEAKDKVKDVYALFGEEDSAVEGINNLMTAGFGGAALDTITDQLAGAAIKWKDTLKFEGLADGLQETLATGKAIGPFVELLERSGIVAEDFDAEMAALSTTAEKQQYVLDTLSSLGLEGVTNGYREANKSLIESQEAQFQYNESMGQVGERVEPVFATIKQGWADVLSAFLVSTQGIDLEALRTNIQNAFSWFINEGIPMIKEFATFVIDNKETILSLITGIGVAFAAWKVTTIVQGATAALKLLWATTEGVTVAQKLMNLVMAANPIGLVITVIAGLVAAFITLWNTSDNFRNFWINLWKKIQSAVQPVLKYVREAFSNTWSAIKSVWNAAKGYFELIWSNIRSIFSVVTSILSGDFRGAWEGIKSIWSNTKSYFSGIVKNIVGYFKNLPSQFVEVGKNMIAGLIDGVKSAAGKLASAAKDAVKGAVNAAKDFLGIRSPSRLMKTEVGMMMGAGIGEGLLASVKTVSQDMDKFNNTMKNKMSEIQSGLSVPTSGGIANGLGGVTNNYTQIINAPKQPSRIELYRDTKNLLALRGLRNV